MLLLFDNNADKRFARFLVGHEVRTAYEMRWADFKNGLLIKTAEKAGFAVIISADKNLAYQQNLKGRSISIIVFGSRFTDFIGIAPLAPQVIAALENLPSGPSSPCVLRVRLDHQVERCLGRQKVST
ncbi:hypothetical protein BH11ARM2_BH11ARM2_27730 [soil metagenome]